MPVDPESAKGQSSHKPFLRFLVSASVKAAR